MLLQGIKTVKSGLLLAARRPLNTLCWPALFAAAIRSAATKQREGPHSVRLL